MASLLTMTWVDLLGFLAGILTTFSAAPQLLYSYRTKDVGSIDLKFMLMLVSGLVAWGIYGIIIRSLPIVFFNFVGAGLWLPIIVMKVGDVRKGESRSGP